MAITELRHQSINWGALAFMLLYVFTPTVVGGFYATLAAITLLSLVYIALKLIKTLKLSGIFVAPRLLLALLALTMLSSSISMFLSSEASSLIRLSEIIKPVIFMTIFVFAANVNLNYSLPEIKKTLILAAKLIIVGELVVVIDQVFDVDVFNVFYDYGKESSTEDAYVFLRSTGTLGNPNYFAWVILQCGVIIQTFTKRGGRFWWLLLVLVMILLSGSKSILVAFPVSMLVITWLKGERVIFNRENLYLLLFAISLVFIIYKFIDIYPNVFPRLNVLIALLTGEDASGGGRFKIWERAYAYFLMYEQGILTWVFGMGPIKYFTTLDNGYLYVFFRYGIVGVVLYLSILLYFLVKFYSFRDKELGGLVVQYVLVSMLIDMQAEAIAGWQFPIWLYFYAGLVASYLYRKV